MVRKKQSREQVGAAQRFSFLRLELARFFFAPQMSRVGLLSSLFMCVCAQARAFGVGVSFLFFQQLSVRVSFSLVWAPLIA
jgi:hypothetical protein